MSSLFCDTNFKDLSLNNREEIEENRRAKVRRPECWPLSSKFKVLTSRIIQTEISSKKQEKKEKLLKEVMVKIELNQEDDQDKMTGEVLLDSGATKLVMSLKFTKKNRFKKKKLKRLIYVRNIV